MDDVCDNQEDPTEYSKDDLDHLDEVLQGALAALDALWRVAGPLLQRSASRNTGVNASWSYYQVFDALMHSIGWLRRMPRRASDGTSVWAEDLPPAVTNEVEEPDALEESEARGAMERRRRQERGAEHQDHGLAGRLITVSNGDTVSRRETPAEAKARKAREEEKRLAKLRRPAPRRKASKRK